VAGWLNHRAERDATAPVLRFTMDVARIELLLLVACVVAILARRLKLPYTVGLVFAGTVMAFFKVWPNIPISKELIFDVLLPPLVFEAAFAIRWARFRRDVVLITTIATLGVIVATAVAAYGMTVLVGWDWRASLIFAALIAATDPVSVIAMMKESKVGGRLKLLVEAESLMNDGTGAAMFAVALGALATGQFMAGTAILSFFTISLGGIVIGAAVGLFCVWLMGRVSDHLVEIALSTVAAYGSFLVGEYFNVSGVLATVAAGMVIGNYGPLAGLSSKGHAEVERFWEFAAFVANSFVFLVMGFKLANETYSNIWVAAAIAIVLVLLGRLLSVFGCCALFSRSTLKVPLKHQALLFWGGLRGALALALALAIPDSMPNYHEVIEVTFVVVAFSVIVQGITVGPLIAKIQRAEPTPAD
jgi:CPA1 family monovalent cation:H+ antiporter